MYSLVFPKTLHEDCNIDCDCNNHYNAVRFSTSKNNGRVNTVAPPNHRIEARCNTPIVATNISRSLSATRLALTFSG